MQAEEKRLTYAAAVADNRSVGRPRIKSNQYNFRLSADVLLILLTVAEQQDTDRTAALEHIVRDYGERHGIETARARRVAAERDASGNEIPPHADASG
jgi:hypothetical protein